MMMPAIYFHSSEKKHDDVIKWKHFPWLLALCAGNSPVNSPNKGQWRGTLMFSLICASRNGYVNNRDAGDLRRHRVHYDVIVMATPSSSFLRTTCNAERVPMRNPPHVNKYNLNTMAAKWVDVCMWLWKHTFVCFNTIAMIILRLG